MNLKWRLYELRKKKERELRFYESCETIEVKVGSMECEVVWIARPQQTNDLSAFSWFILISRFMSHVLRVIVVRNV